MLDHQALCDVGTKLAQTLAELISLWSGSMADAAPAAGPSHGAAAAANDTDASTVTVGTAATTAAGMVTDATMAAAAAAAD
eukprot:6159289-Prymnesium_polylepis.1